MNSAVGRFIALRAVLRRTAPNLEKPFALVYYSFNDTSEPSLAAAIEWLRTQPLSDDVKMKLITWRLEG